MELCFEDGHAIALFVGCANEPFLHLYIENNLMQKVEKIIPDSEKWFLPDLSSLTMSLFTLHDEQAKMHYLAIGSQNGMISIVAFWLGKTIYAIRSTFVFNIHAVHREMFCWWSTGYIPFSSILHDKYYIDLVVGSLHAFACMYQKTVLLIVLWQLLWRRARRKLGRKKQLLLAVGICQLIHLFFITNWSGVKTSILWYMASWLRI